MIHNTIKVHIKFVYGQKTVYPANELAKQFCTLLGTKTLTPLAIRQLKEMNFHFEAILDESIAAI